MSEELLLETKSFKLRLVDNACLLDTFERIAPSIIQSALKDFPSLIDINLDNIAYACTTAPKSDISVAEKIADVEIEFTESDLEAFLIINCSNEEFIQRKPSIFAEIKEKITSSGIVHGIISEAFTKICGTSRILFARGDAPVPGKDSVIDVPDVLSVSHSSNADVVDYYSLNLIHTMKKGDYIGERSNPTQGTPGKSVKGNPISTEPGKLLPLRYDRNTIEEVPEENKVVLRAKMTGALHLHSDGETLTVYECVELPNVDFSTGNVNTECFVIVHGTIEDGFQVYSSKGVEVRGNLGVGKVTIASDGDIIIRGGISGKGIGNILSGGSVFTKFVNDATIEAENIIDVASYSINSNLKAGKVIVGSSSKGAIIGGSVEALYLIQCKSVGNEFEKETSLTVTGFDRESVIQEFDNLKKQILPLKNELSSQQNLLRSLKCANPPNYRDIETTKSNIDEVKEAINQTDIAIKFFYDLLKTKGEGEIKISNYVYPNTLIAIRDANTKITALEHGCNFHYSEGLKKT